jgi:c-di-AMP phosphodiesterase-like protein
MSNHAKMKGKLAGFFHTPIRLGIFLILVNVLIYFMHWPSGIVLSIFLAVYFVIVIYQYVNNRAIIRNELISFATQYGQVQKQLLKNLDLPYAVLDETGRIVWTNYEFERVAGTDKLYRRQISAVFPSLTKDTLPTGEDDVRMQIDYESSNYRIEMRRIPLDSMAEDSDILDATGYDGALIALYLFNETAVRLALQEVDDQSVVIGFIYMDNYEEALDSVEDVKRSLLIALIDRKVNKYISSIDGICSKIEKDKYLCILRKKSLVELQNAHFALLGDVKTVNIGNDMPITLSIGIGMEGLTYAQNYEFARNAIDLALGRGGDQAVVKTQDNIIYYGGKTQQVEKNTRVKARVKAEALKEIISGKDTVFIMGHRIGDIDCLGAGIGIYRIAKTMNRDAHIVLNDVSTSLQPIVDTFRNNPEYPEDLFYTSQQAIEKVSDNAALVVVDVNKPSITECPELLKLCKSIVVLDHHRAGSETIENATLSYVEAYASSACEMVSEILQYIGENIRIRPEEADAMYAGIVVDTNNFQNKTGVRTFEAAAFLRRNGTDVTRVRKLFRENASEYKAKADAVSQAEIYRSSYAISICPGEGIQSPTIIGAQAANELLNIKGVKASFVLTEYQNQIFISARSIDEVNVQLIMEHLGGGGHMNMAGCQMSDLSLAEAISVLKHTIDTMIEDGEL